MINHSLVIAWRNLARYKSFSIINILGLSIGIMCCLVISVFVQYELSFDNHHEKANQIYRVVQHTKFLESTEYWNTTAYPLAEALREDFADIPLVTQASGPVSRLFKIEDETGNVSRFEEHFVLFVDTFYPKVFDFKWLAGNPDAALIDPNSVVLTKSIAYKYFGKELQLNKSIIGKQIFLNNKDALTVTGIVEDAPANTSLRYNILIPYDFFKKHNTYFATNWSGNYQGTTFLVLKEGTPTHALETRVAQWKKKYLKPEDNNRISYKLQPLKEIHTDGTYGYSPQSYIMPKKNLYGAAFVGAFILVIACVNFINLATAQAANRAKEVGIRKVLGSTRIRLIHQFIGENILLVGFALVIALALAQISITKLNDLLTIIGLNLFLDWRSILTVISLGILVMMLACFYPAIVMASFQPANALRNKFNLQSVKGLSVRKGLIIFQFAIVQLFILGTLVIALQMHYFYTKDLGFNRADAIVVINLNSLDKNEVFKQKLQANAAISEVSFASSPPVSDYNFHYGTTFRLPAQSEEQGKEAEMKGVDLHYIDFYNLKLLAGRNFTSLEENFKEFIVNEKLVREMGWTPEEAIGQPLAINEGEAVIVGVVKDFHNNSLQDDITPCILIHWNSFLERASIKLHNKSNMTQTLSFIESTWKEVYPEEIYNYSFLEDALAKNYTIEQLIFKGFTTFSLLTIIIGCLGLYGLLSFMTIRRTKEVGIRKVLGASVLQIVELFSKEFITLIAISIIIAVPIAYYFMDQWLAAFVYHIDLSWWMFVLGALTTIIITLLTISYQSIKAGIVNPVDSLRNE